MTTSVDRQAWVEQSVAMFRDHFQWFNWTVPANVRVSIGIPKGSHGGKKAIGQCWNMTASADGFFEIFVSPELGHDGKPKPGNKATLDMLETIAHELIHATVGHACGHRGAFKDCALAVGFIGPMTTTPAGDTMKVCMQRIIDKIGEFPAGALDISMKKKQSTRLLKCECMDCGYIARVTEKWVVSAGAPICPVDEIEMMCE